MDKIKNLLRRIGSGSFKRMLVDAKRVNEETGYPIFFVLLDMTYCIIRYNIGYLDYFIFGFASKNNELRKTYLTYNDNSALFRMADDKELSYLLKDKLEFNRRYKDYLGRDFFDPETQTIAEFKKFIKNKKKLFIKPSDSFGGLGEYKPIIVDDSADIEELYKYLKDNKVFVEELIEQHPTMSKLCKTSINTVRIATLVVNNEVHCLYSVLRMGIDNMTVDNSSSGGLNTRLDDDGTITRACFSDKTVKYYTKHPTTGMELVGFKVPMYKEAIELCKKAALVEPKLGYIGWDIAITKNGPVIVEANDLPGYDMPQNHGTSYIEEGIKPQIEKILGREIN